MHARCVTGGASVAVARSLPLAGGSGGVVGHTQAASQSFVRRARNARCLTLGPVWTRRVASRASAARSCFRRYILSLRNRACLRHVRSHLASKNSRAVRKIRARVPAVVVVQLRIVCNVLCLLPSSFKGSSPLRRVTVSIPTTRRESKRERERRVRKKEEPPTPAIGIEKHPLRRDYPNFRGTYRASRAYVRTCARTSCTFGIPFGSVSPFTGATTCWPWKSATTRDGRCLKSDAPALFTRAKLHRRRECMYTRELVSVGNANPIPAKRTRDPDRGDRERIQLPKVLFSRR